MVHTVCLVVLMVESNIYLHTFIHLLLKIALSFNGSQSHFMPINPNNTKCAPIAIIHISYVSRAHQISHFFFRLNDLFSGANVPNFEPA